MGRSLGACRSAHGVQIGRCPKLPSMTLSFFPPCEGSRFTVSLSPPLISHVPSTRALKNIRQYNHEIFYRSKHQSPPSFPFSQKEIKESHPKRKTHHDRLPAHIAAQRARHRQNHARRLRRRARPPQRDVRVRRIPRGLALRARDPERDPAAVGRGGEGAFLLGGRQAGRDVAEGDGVGAHAEGWAPFFRDGLGEAGDAGFGDGVVGLAAAAQTRRVR